MGDDDDVFMQRFREDACHRLARSGMTMQQVWSKIRSTPDDLREQGLTVMAHHDHRVDGKLQSTTWLLIGEVGGVARGFTGEGPTDEAALDQIRAAYARATDDRHHAPLCPANHYHGARAPTGACSCGAEASSNRREKR